MRNKFIPLVVALVFGSIAAVGFTKMMKASPQVETIEIFVAVRDIAVAEEITEDAIRLTHWPASTVPRDAIQDWKAMEGKFASQRLYAEEPVVLRKLMDTADSKTVEIPKGFNVVTLKTDEASSVANLVSPGDRVNVIGFFTKSDVIPATTTRTVLSGVKVFAVDGRTARKEADEADSKTKAARTVSLLIHAGDAEAWTCAKEMGKISLSLGRPDESLNANDNGPNPAGQAFLNWLTAHQEAKNRKERPEPLVMPVPAPVVSAPVDTQAPPPAVEHQMVKIGPDGQMSVYTWVEGNPIPQLSGGSSTPASSSAPAEAEAASPRAAANGSQLEFLHGEGSPLYSDPQEPPRS